MTTSLPFLRKNGNRKTVALITLWDSHAAGTAYTTPPSLFKNRERVPAKGYISDQLTDEAIGVVDRAKTLDQPFMLYLAYNAPHLPNDNPAPEQLSEAI
ncbi:sulfatase ydeN [Escherichia coli]|uniref:Sulfatase ydeN n=1 Tax=Escherichia coli TaxID=562 RepID=A0A484X6Z2_ECOLX|nr:sulfatase ydeN [Escherichia coli]